MELYNLIATVNNTATTFTFDYLPENFEGMKVSQNFSFVNPMGYTPKFSIETMRAILNDKSTLDTVFLTYGLESDVEIEIQKLNALGTSYESVATFAIDFESYTIEDEFSEFALKAISTIDYYNSIKNTEMQYPLGTTGTVKLPTTQKFYNTISLKNYDTLFTTDYEFLFAKNKDSKIYNKDISLYPAFEGDNGDENVYIFGENSTTDIKIYFSLSVHFKITGVNDTTVALRFLKHNNDNSKTTLYYYNSFVPISEGGTDINLDVSETEINLGVCLAGERLTVQFEANAGGTIVGDVFFDMKVLTEKQIINSENNLIKFAYTYDFLRAIFNNNITQNGYNTSYAITSGNSIMKLNNFVTIKPKDFLTDFCTAFGLVLNFKLDGSVQLDSITNIFNALLDVYNAIEIVDYKDLTIKHNTSLNFSSVSAGKEINDYDIFSYLIDWNKILTFKQENRNATDNLDLTLTKLRTDFSGMLDYFYKRSQQSQSNSKDNFIFNSVITKRTGTDASINMYDYLTPRDILTNWKRFLSFCFQNYGKDTLTISSNGGTTDNLEISGVKQMDDFVLAETPRLLPVEYEFTCLIDSVDFSENILKINHNGTDVYLFVIKAETTDNLSEQKVNCLKIQF